MPLRSTSEDTHLQSMYKGTADSADISMILNTDIAIPNAGSYCMCHTILPLTAAFHCTFVYKYQNVNKMKKALNLEL